MSKFEQTVPQLYPLARYVGRPLIEVVTCVHFETNGTMSPTICNVVLAGVQQSMEYAEAVRLGARIVAMGIIQWTRVALDEHERVTGVRLEWADLAEMTVAEQVELARSYFSRYRSQIGRLEDLYLAILYPAVIGKPDSHRVFLDPSRAYRLNRGLDRDKDGDVEVGEICRRIRKEFATVQARWMPCWDRNPPECSVRGGEGG